MTYEKDMVLPEKFEHFFLDELTFKDDELREIVDLTYKIESNHRAMDEETFKTKMLRFCELITNGLIKKALIDYLTEYLERNKYGNY